MSMSNHVHVDCGQCRRLMPIFAYNDTGHCRHWLLSIMTLANVDSCRCRFKSMSNLANVDSGRCRFKSMSTVTECSGITVALFFHRVVHSTYHGIGLAWYSS